MIISFNQTRSNLCSEYEFVLSGETIYTASIPRSFSGVHTYFYENQNPRYILDFNHLENMKNLARKRIDHNIIPYNIRNMTNECVGSIYIRRSKKFFGYLFYEIDFEGLRYNAYEIGFGKKGISIPIYYGELQIGLMEKSPVVYDNKDRYTIYVKDKTKVLQVCLFAIYYDFINFGHFAEVAYKSKKSYYLYTTNKELKSKYKPGFKDEISSTS